MKLKPVRAPSHKGRYTIPAGYAPSIPNRISEGNSREQALADIRQALELYVEGTTIHKPGAQAPKGRGSPMRAPILAGR